MNVEVHIICRNEAEILPYTLRHYRKFCNWIFLHDFGSTDGSAELVRPWEFVPEDTADKVDDRVNLRIKETCWHGSDADWCIVVDADELIFFPTGAIPTLTDYAASGVPIVKPQGWDMTSDVYPATKGQIYDEIKSGCRNPLYSKPVLFSPKLVESIAFMSGAHGIVSATLKDGRILNDPIFCSTTVYLLHFHHIGPVERIGKRYDETRARMCDYNVTMNFGNVHEPGLPHAIWQRNNIMSKLEKVII